MRQEWIGDALDIFKRSVVAWLGALDRDRLVIAPFPSDAPWQAENWLRYARGIGIDSTQVPALLRAGWGMGVPRAGYLATVAASAQGDCAALLLDPDTGVNENGNWKYVRFSDVNDLLVNSSIRVVAIYQHGVYGDSVYRRQVLHDYRLMPIKTTYGLRCFAYDAGAACAVFVTRNDTAGSDSFWALTSAMASDRAIDMGRIVV